MTSKAVTENAEGTKVEAEGSSTPEAEAKTPESESKVSPKEEKVEEKPTITKTQNEALVHMATSEAGRLQKVAETERDGFKTKAEKAEALVEDIQAERDKLQTGIEELTNDDPKKFDLVKRDKELRDAQRTLKTATDELATQQKDNETIVTTAKETLLEIAIWEVATEYKGGDPVRLKALCATLGVTDEVKLREVAGNLWEKSEAKVPDKKGEVEEPKEKLNLDGGDTHGGGEETEQEKLDKRYPKTAKK
ncbi:hypothetical protein LCGC14_0684680 [marine sediment metagenome]|uniref:Scaffolding protein n=1 Tax=marine sediment metagenome TaxID=412755 RepID=A0A0F9R7K3_9ZZZZ